MQKTLSQQESMCANHEADAGTKNRVSVKYKK